MTASPQHDAVAVGVAWQDLDRHRQPEGRVLRHRVDAGPLCFVLAIATAQAMLYLQPSALLAALGALALWPLQTRSIYIAHNQHHHRVFRQGRLNLLFEALLFLQTGLPSYGFPLHHNLGHHARYLNQDPADPDADPHCWVGPDGRRLTRWAYTRRLLATAVPRARRIGLRHPRLWRSFLRVAACYGVALALLAAVRPAHTLAVFLVPMALSLVALAWSTYVHHLGLPTDDPLGASYTNVDRWANRWGYGIGYHTAHHLRPGLHWSQLSALHERIASGVPSHCYYDGKVAPYATVHWPVP
ncbi:MAG TPA: fatty acid desaturase [Burkholderiaceae bacterium]|nr:fatty acid desaturase [Burkholderiaceae bacterium]